MCAGWPPDRSSARSNGSGKTTFLRALTGDVDHGGSLHLNGQDITGFPSWKLASLRGVLPQATTLAFPFTVIEVVRLGLLAGHSSQDDTLPRQALAKVGLTGYEGRFFQELSGGEQQRAQLDLTDNISVNLGAYYILDKQYQSIGQFEAPGRNVSLFLTATFQGIRPLGTKAKDSKGRRARRRPFLQ
ncbi:ATP-binding cassette domain-containing protein [Aliiroseovarius sp. Z3]|uniref:ATP-binding cassette domain-containing protein n=1 Tax=Aliiroseovarius sp. Z3 TaxID=2811402 RepID=UPI0023B2A1D8|nr:ATP-binding cassette domain-containing protein [Aliiroseovarius sp. Z3]MDE9451903.1 ATP-binding cassette domain-containing protein [Aliiroseovarius sp. Z3]